MVSFLASKGGRKLVIAGEVPLRVRRRPGRGHHPAVGRAHQISPALVGELKVARNQSLEGLYVLMAFDTDLTPDDQAFLIQAGFAKTEVKYGDRTGPALRYFGSVKGRRYEAGVLKQDEAVDFSRTQYLKYVERGNGQRPRRQGRADAAGPRRRRLAGAGRGTAVGGAGRHGLQLPGPLHGHLLLQMAAADRPATARGRGLAMVQGCFLPCFDSTSPMTTGSATAAHLVNELVALMQLEHWAATASWPRARASARPPCSAAR